MDISELEWTEKEKILRILYTKITMGVNPEYWKRLEEVGRRRNMNMSANNNSKDGSEQTKTI
jgi:hypothetical protein